LTVQNVLDYQNIKGRSLLKFYYFNSSKISFVDELLDELNVPPELRITKPGNVTPDEWRVINHNLHTIELDKYNALPEVERKRVSGLQKKERNQVSTHNNIILDKYDRGVHSKESLMRKNHNHK
jgi:bifunctional ADP-heptose synthase (sugar kinase/adenylyltransferase)